MAQCSYSLQYAESDFDEVDDKGIAAPTEILPAFDTFDWPAQARAAEQIQKCSPTFAVREVDSERFFWVSAYGLPELKFVNEYSDSRSTRELSMMEARRAIQLFVDGDHNGLLTLLKA